MSELLKMVPIFYGKTCKINLHIFYYGNLSFKAGITEV